MNTYIDVFAYGSSGTKTITCGFQPTYIRIVVSKKFNVTDNASHLCDGSCDGTVQAYDSIFSDTGGAKSVNGFNKIVSHYERVAGVITEVLAATFVSFTATGAQINITVPNANYNMRIELMG